jgi:hypothetical protein
LSESIYEQLLKVGVEVPELPLENVVLVTAFGKRSKRIRRQALIEFTIGNDLFEGVFMITPQLPNEAIISCQLLKEYGISLNFAKENFSYAREGELREHLFNQQSGLQKVASNDRSSAEDPFRKHPTFRGQRPYSRPADGSSQIFTPQQAKTAGIKAGKVKEAGSPTFIEGASRGSKKNGDSTLDRGAESDLILEDRRVGSNDGAALTISQSKGYFSKDAFSQQNLVINYVVRDPPIRTEIPNSEPDPSDPRSLRKTDLSALVGQIINIREEQKEDLYRVLEKYVGNMTTKPGRCKLFKYKFQVELDKPIVGYSRPIPFATRPAVREQINLMLKDGIIETSYSPILNPLTSQAWRVANFRPLWPTSHRSWWSKISPGMPRCLF